MSRYVEYDYDHECIICLDGDGKLQSIIQAQYCEVIDDELEQLFLEIPHQAGTPTKQANHEFTDTHTDKQASLSPQPPALTLCPPLYIQLHATATATATATAASHKHAMAMYPNYATPGTPNGKSAASQMSPISPVSLELTSPNHTHHLPYTPAPYEDYVQTRMHAPQQHSILPLGQRRAVQQGLDQFDSSASDKRLCFGASDERSPDVIDTVSRELARNGDVYEVYGTIGVADSYQWRFILHGDSKMIVGLIDADIAGPQEMEIYFDLYSNEDVLTALFGTEKPEQGLAIIFIYDVDLQQLIIKNNEPGHAYKGREYIVKRDIDVAKRYKLSLLLMDKALIQVW
eukprot:CAMPEP_0197023184 /NCGR_PEP_ID=MMETSP1384-20130603/3968_1 /TAXON_ID=29189 /ORGANISM="Ammonia sp." /LENGTH=344 /DNA_ID=CAMNT_0042451373 /DNA_START=203 /DNA_END=1237 /DNA_ORIENTATION=-